MRLSRVKNLLPAPKDAEQLYLVVTPSRLSINESGNWKDNRDSFTVEVWKQKGNDDPTQTDMGDYAVHVFKNGSSTVSVLKRNTASFSVQATKSDLSFDVRLKVGDAFVQTITVDVARDGNGISSITEYYLASASSSGVTTKAEGWTTDPTATAATITATKKYLWNYEKITYTNGTSVLTTPSIIGKYGDKGVSISSITEYYLASSAASGITRSTNGWTTDPTAIAATLTATNKYLWNYEKITYSDNSVENTDPVIIGVYGDKGDKGDKGDTGNGVSSITEYYLASASGSGITTSTTGWTADPTAAAATLTATKKYLWNYEKVTYTDGSSVSTTPAIIGKYGDKGDKGTSITSVTEYYLASANYTGITTSSSGWSTDPTSNAAKLTASKKYLWNYESIAYSDGTTDETAPVIIGVYGDKGDKGDKGDGGDKGDTGNGISSITEYYLASSSGSGVTTSTTGWTTSPTATAATMTSTKKYLWNYEKITYTNGDVVNTTPAIIGRYGDKGDKGDRGVSITSVTEYYLASSSYTGITTLTSGWTTDPTDTAAKLTTSKKYLWNYESIGYSDGTTDETNPVIIGVYGDKGNKGDQGDTGNGISSITTYYLATTMATGVTRSTTGWTSTYQQGTQDSPYVWRYSDTLYSNGTHTYTDCELIFSYSAGANPNLLEQTNFSSLQALDKWTQRNACVPLTGVTVTQESYASIQTGIQAHNAYYDRTIKTTSQIQYKEILEQCLWSVDGTIRKLEASTWYTLSFWAKGNYNIASFIYPSVFDNSVVCYIDGVMQAANTRSDDAYINWSLTSTWKRHTFTFKTKTGISGSDQKLLFRLYPKDSSSYTNAVYLCMPKLEVGMQATGYLSNDSSIHTGQPRRRRWAINTQYMAGGVDEPFDDVVLYGESGFYHCIKSHISNLENSPVGTYASQYWSSANSAMFELLATDIFFAEKALINNLIATLIQTGYEGAPHIEAEGSEFKIFGKGQYPAIYLAVNDDNKAVLRFQNENTGEFLYDLGPDGIMKEFSEVADSYSEFKYHKLTSVTRVSELLNITASQCTSYYRFSEGYKQIGSGSSATKQYHVSGTSTPSAKNSRFFTSKNYNGSYIPDGWYCKSNNGVYMAEAQNEPGQSSVYVVYIYQFSSGRLTSSVPVYFKKTDSQSAMHSVGCDENGNELSTSTYQYLYSYWQQNNITL